MTIDCHVHTCAFDPAHGLTSDYLLNTFAFRFMRWRLGLGKVQPNDQIMEAKLFQTVDGTPEIDRVVLIDHGRIVADGPKREVLVGARLSELFGLPLELTEREGYYNLW